MTLYMLEGHRTSLKCNSTHLLFYIYIHTYIIISLQVGNGCLI